MRIKVAFALMVTLSFIVLPLNVFASMCESWLDDGWEKVLTEDYKGAIKEYTKAIECDKDLALAYNNRGWAYKAMGSYEKAINDFNKAIKLDNNSVAKLMALENRAACFIRLGRYQQGITDCKKAIEGGHLFAYGSLGLAQMSLNDYKEAVKSLEKVLSVVNDKGLCIRASLFDTFKICISSKEVKEWSAALKRAKAGPTKTPVIKAEVPNKTITPQRQTAKSPFKIKQTQKKSSVDRKPAEIATRPDWSGGSMWLMAVGVAEYQSAGYTLRYATSDALAVLESFKRQPRGLFRSIMDKALLNEKVTRESVLSAIVQMAKQVTNQDTVVIFMSGHGVQNKVTGSFYFLPYQANASNYLYKGLHWASLEEAIATLQARVKKIVFFIDTCNSGAIDLAQLIQPGTRIASTGSTQLRKVMSSLNRGAQYRGIEVGSGATDQISGSLYKLTATRAGEQAVEKPEWAHGAFSYALLEGLGGKADKNKDRLITVIELFEYVQQRVRYLTGGAQNPSFAMPTKDAVLVKSP